MNEEALLVVHSSSSEAGEASPSALASACPAAEEVELQVQNWRFSELHSTNLAALREVDVCIPFRLPAMADAHWNKLIASPTVRGPNRARPEWFDAATAHWAALKGLACAKHPTKQQLNSPWFKMYCRRDPTVPEPSALKGVSSFPYWHKADGEVQYWQINTAANTLWGTAKAKVAQLAGVPIPKGVPPWGADEEELLEQPGAGTQTTNGPPSANPTEPKYRSAIWLSHGEAGSSKQGWRRKSGWDGAGSDQVAWVPAVSLDCHVAPAVASMPPFYSALLCYSSLCSCASTSVKHGLAVPGAWSYHVVLRCCCSGLAPLADHHGVPWAGPAHR